LTLPGDKKFTVEAKKLSSKNKYVKSIHLNGKPCTNDFITYQDIMNGGRLVYEMTDKPVRSN
jgi:putative alpha-1,2-mannosidase